MRTSRIVWIFAAVAIFTIATNKAQEEMPNQEDVSVEVEQEETEAPEQADTQEPAEEVVEEESSSAPSPEEQESEEPASTTDEEAVEPSSEQDSEQTKTQEEPDEEVVVEESEESSEPVEQKEEEKPAQEEPASAQPALVPEPEPETPIGPDEVVGIDTVDLEDPQGNWLFKRVWWERAEAKYEKIRAAVTKVMEQRTVIFEKRSALDRDVFDPFYLSIGFKRGQLQEVLTNLIATLESKTNMNMQGSLLEKVQQDKKALEELQIDVDKVLAQDQEVEKALLQLVEQMNRLRNYEQQAWKDFKDIARVLDDRKARELFYQVDNAWRNVQEIQTYVIQTFTPSFDKVIEEAKQQTERVQSMVEDLKDKGMTLKQELDGEKEEADEDEQESSPTPTVFERFVKAPLVYLFNGLKKLFSMVISLLRWPFDMLSGAKKTSADIEEDETIEIDAVEEDDTPQSGSTSGASAMPEAAAPVAEPEMADAESESSGVASSPTEPVKSEQKETPQESIEIEQETIEESDPAVDQLAPMDEDL